MYGEARSNRDILYQIVCIYSAINLLHILIIQILHYQPIKNYTFKINPHTGESRLQYLNNFIPNTFIDDVNVGFSSCFHMNKCVFSITGLVFVERDKLLAGYSWLHQVLKKIFSKAILYTHKVYQKMFI